MVQLPSRASHEKLLQVYREPANDVAQHGFQTRTELVKAKPGSRAVHAHVVNAPAPNPFGGPPLNPAQVVPMQIAAQPAGPSTDAKLKEVIFCADTRPVEYQYSNGLNSCKPKLRIGLNMDQTRVLLEGWGLTLNDFGRFTKENENHVGLRQAADLSRFVAENHYISDYGKFVSNEYICITTFTADKFVKSFMHQFALTLPAFSQAYHQGQVDSKGVPLNRVEFNSLYQINLSHAQKLKNSWGSARLLRSCVADLNQDCLD